MAKQLRFAALIRVSGERQAKLGESLRTQTAQIEQAVEQLGGVITKRLSGQEHATPGYERKMLEELLADCAKERKPFDAVMVATASRWSRDNARSQDGLDVLKDNHIRFFVLGQESNLFDPAQFFFLALNASIGRLEVDQRNLLSMQNRIAKAKRGIPCSGNLPYGRSFDKDTNKWSIIAEAQEELRDIAQRYIGGESLMKIGEAYGVDYNVLYDRLNKAGSEWKESYENSRFRINETVWHKVPPLLDAKTLKAVRKTAEANNTYKHGHIKHQYLLSRMIFCKECGSTLSGQKRSGNLPDSGVHYYRHLRRTAEQKACSGPGHVRADIIEKYLIEQLFEVFGNPEGVKKAIESVIPNKKELDGYQRDLVRVEQKLSQIADKRAAQLKRNNEGRITDDECDKALDNLRELAKKLEDERDRLTAAIGNVPSVEDIKDAAKAARQIHWKIAARRKYANDLDNMSWEDKRALVEQVFAGKDVTGRRHGVYVEQLEKGVWRYEVHGILPSHVEPIGRVVKRKGVTKPAPSCRTK